MPARLLDISSTELNYIAARNGNKLMLAFTNQSAKPVTARVTIDPLRVQLNNKSTLGFYTTKQNSILTDSSFTITVPANGLTAVAIEGAGIRSAFQGKLLDTSFTASKRDYRKLKTGRAHAMLLQLGSYQRRLFRIPGRMTITNTVRPHWHTHKRKWTTANDHRYSLSFEFTVPVGETRPVSFSLSLIDTAGKRSEK